MSFRAFLASSVTEGSPWLLRMDAEAAGPGSKALLFSPVYFPGQRVCYKNKQTLPCVLSLIKPGKNHWDLCKVTLRTNHHLEFSPWATLPAHSPARSAGAILVLPVRDRRFRRPCGRPDPVSTHLSSRALGSADHPEPYPALRARGSIAPVCLLAILLITFLKILTPSPLSADTLFQLKVCTEGPSAPPALLVSERGHWCESHSEGQTVNR